MDKTQQQDLIRGLPTKLRVQLSNHMYSQDLKDIKYFDHKSPEFIASIAPLLKPLKAAKGDYIYLKGDVVDGVYFIKRGEAAFVEKRSAADLIFATNITGSYFGDVDFAASDELKESKRLYSVKAMSDMDLLLLKKEDIYEMDMEFKDEVMGLFTRSHSQLCRLKKMLKKGHFWLSQKFDSFFTQDFNNADDSNCMSESYSSARKKSPEQQTQQNS